MPEGELLALVGRLGRDPEVHGILVQLPLPPPLRAPAVIEALAPEKDVDGLHPVNQGRLLAGLPGLRPCTPLGILRLVDATGAALGGAHAVVVGRSVLVGKPVALLLPVSEAHRALGGRLVECAGWEMPLSYRGIAEEHQAVRRHCGLFDVSHMGEIEVSGPSAAAVCQELMVNDVARLGIGDAQYTLLCNETGGVLDDLVVYRLGAERYLLIVNAGNGEQDLGWITSHVGARASVVDRSAELALLALQGPEAEVALRTLTALDLTSLRAFTARQTRIAGEAV